MKPLAAALIVSGFACLGPVSAPAAEWPTRPVRIIAPATPGGAADTFGRILRDHFPDILGGRFFVENRAGAGGLIGAQATANAAGRLHLRDLERRLSRDRPGDEPQSGVSSAADFTHIAYIGGPPNVFVVNPASACGRCRSCGACARRPADRLRVPRRRDARPSHRRGLAQRAGIKLQQFPPGAARRR